MYTEKTRVINCRNIFVWGLTGSGKDTISNYLVRENNYLKLRIADTIKRIICETQNLSFDELEEQKRTNPALRMMHHEVSAILDKLANKDQSSLNRVEQLINGNAFDYHEIQYHEYVPKVICDCRTTKEAEAFLKAGWTGIFLSRTTNEFKHDSHFTEQNMFKNGQLVKLIESYKDQIYTIWNGNVTELSDLSEIQKELLEHELYFETNGTVSQLQEVVDSILSALTVNI